MFLGTRPQVIKASVLRDALATVRPVVAVDTGQHYDHALHSIHYEQLGVREPDAYLGVGSGSQAVQTAAILTACAAWIEQHRPSLAVVIGDTNSTLACALAAAKLRVPVAHVEAGLRAGTWAGGLMAEEINRRAVDAIAELLFAPCQRVAAALSRQFPDAAVEATGDVAHDVLRRALPNAPPLERVAGFTGDMARGFVYVTLHRAELVDDEQRLRRVMDALGRSPLHCFLPAHPRTRATLDRLGYALPPNVRISAPVGYLESVTLLRHAAVVVTDSGGLQREAYWIGVPCVTVRGETEWLETVECGANRLVAPEEAHRIPDEIARAAGLAHPGTWDRDVYGAGDAAPRIAAAVGRWVHGRPRSSS